MRNVSKSVACTILSKVIMKTILQAILTSIGGSRPMSHFFSKRRVVFYRLAGIDIATGIGVVILSGVRIVKGSVVSAGAVVTKDVPAGVLAAGIPVK